MNLNDLQQAIANNTAPAIEVRAVELSLYVPYYLSDEDRLPLCDAKDAPLKYPSRYAALHALAKTGLQRVTVVHASAYDEMIGMDTQVGQNEMTEQVSLDAYA